MLLSPNNLLKPSDGGLVAVPSQDMILGVYYLTMRKLADYKDDPKMVAQVSSDTVYNDIEELRKLTTPDENKERLSLAYMTSSGLRMSQTETVVCFADR